MTAPDPGPRPRLAWIPLDVLDVDERYQREIDTRAGQRVIAKIADGFAWKKFAPLIVTPSDEDGRFMVLDGQHKAAAARLVGGIDAVPAMIVETDGVADQAESFVSLNNDRVRVHQYALHRAQVAAGDPAALAIDRVCAAAAVIVPAYPVPADRIAARQTMALKVIGAMIRQHGEDIAARGLKLVADIYEDRPGSIRANLIKAVCAVLSDRPDFAGAKLRERVAGKSAIAWEHEAQQTAERAGVTVIAALIAALKGEPIALPPSIAAAEDTGGESREGRHFRRLPAPVNKICACGVAFKTDVIGLDKCMRCNA